MAARFDMIGIFAGDLGKMVAFYRDVLRFEIKWDGQGPYAEFRHDGIRFSMNERSELPKLLGAEPSYPEGMNGFFQLAIDLPDTEDVDGEFKRVVSCGARPVYPPREEPWGMYSSMVADPEGNLIEIGSWEKGKPLVFQLGVVTISVSCLNEARKFYEGVLGFEADFFYEPTKWLAFKNDGKSLFAIEEMPGLKRSQTQDTIDFYLENIEYLWERIKNSVTVVNKLERTPWGSYKFVIQDPDGQKLGFVKKE